MVYCLFVLLHVISIHSLRKEGDPKRYSRWGVNQKISIHSLRKEGDVYHSTRARGCYFISIHSLRKEGDNNRGFLRR